MARRTIPPSARSVRKRADKPGAPGAPLPERPPRKPVVVPSRSKSGGPGGQN